LTKAEFSGVCRWITDQYKQSNGSFILYRVLPGFYDVTYLTTLDITFVGLVSAAVPSCGNTILVLIFDRASLIIAS